MAKYTVNMADQLLKVREKVQEKLKKEAEVVVEIEQPSALQSATVNYLSKKEEPHPLSSPTNLNEEQLDEMKKASVEFGRTNKSDMMKAKKDLEKKGHKVKVSGNKMTVTAKSGSDIDRELSDIRNFYDRGVKIKAEQIEETLDENVNSDIKKILDKEKISYRTQTSKHSLGQKGIITGVFVQAKDEKKAIIALGKISPYPHTIVVHGEEVELDEGRMKELAMKIAQVYSNMKKDKNMRSFADKFRKDVAKSLDIRKSLEKVLPDYVAGKDITNIMSKHVPGHKEEGLDEKVSYVEYKFKNARDAGAAKKYFDAQQRMSFDVNDDNIRGGELMVDAGKNDMTQFHKEVMKKFRPKVMSTEAKLIDKPTGEVLKTGSKEEMETERKRNRDELQVQEWFKSKNIDVKVRQLDESTQVYVPLGRRIPNEIREELITTQYGKMPEDVKNVKDINYGNFVENSITMNNDFWTKVLHGTKGE